ncbi:leucyl/phenylalanyl-tRNA--protein transferase [Marilutibacter aestuarii]|uniref:Leucyl/phenylalanyl-tRNA--protein transferase n=1 Tax=Marilutibacter aestuarii TaxID=1706195 RepID=A0A508A6K2_9GAMM|nr:leucyl/phenylalanyl-tRNA--protein transferase [Lysobacter aestuarii]TQD42615.1 leucyl/phenylalanyl-tRNA--protein transferase [Lysobacter aestuarii]
MNRLPFLLDADPHAPFPPAGLALEEPNGLLAVGGDLSVPRLLNAYRHGIFPWYSAGQPILWWSPDPRVMFSTASGGVHLSRRFRRSLRASDWVVRADHRFEEVVGACASLPRPGQDGTWITGEMRRAYGELHRLGHAHSIEVMQGERLVGGLYGIAVGRMFFGESMFSASPGGSKVALAALARRLGEWGWPWLDAQVTNPHLLRMGAVTRPREAFLRIVDGEATRPGRAGPWRDDFGVLPANAFAAPV